MITAALAATLPSIINLFNSDSKDEAVEQLTNTVVQTAATKLGLNTNSVGKEDIVRHLESNPRDAVKLKEIESMYKLEIERLNLEKLKTQEENITKRWISDNNKGSTFAKLLRPTLTAFLVFVCVLLAVLDGNIGDFNIKEHWVTLFTTLCITSVGGYFTLRTYEKRTNTSKWNQSK